MGKFWSMLFAAMMIFCGGTFVIAPMMGWWLPEGVSSHSGAIDYLFYVILIITGFFFILTEAILCIFMWKYSGDRDKAEVPPPPGYAAKLFRPVTNLLNDQHKVEMAWTMVPALILLYIAFAQVKTWADAKYISRMPSDKEQRALQVDVSARQFEWRIRYPSSERFEDWMARRDDPDVAKDYRSFASSHHKDDIHVVNELHVIKNNPVIVHLTTRDVLHSFNLPHLRVKQDALPGKMIPVWFTPTKANVRLDSKLGIYVDGFNPVTGKSDDPHHIWDLACAELCGWGHYRMIGRLFVHDTEAEFLDWLRKAEASGHSTKPANIVSK